MGKKAQKISAATLPFLEDFLLHIQSGNYSDRTLQSYERDLRTFSLFLSFDVCVPFEQMTKRTVEQFKAYLQSKDRKTASGSPTTQRLQSGSINRTLVTLRRYLAYLIDMDEPVPVPPGSVKLLRTEKKHPQVAELEQLTMLIEAPTQFENNPLVALRNRAALETLFASGMRISELISLRRDQIDGTGKIFIQGKGKKQRFVYLTKRAKQHVDRYLRGHRDDSIYLFIPHKGARARKPIFHISANYLQMKIKKYRELLGINVPTSAHSLRHGFATYLAEQGADPAAIKTLLGHESLETTTRYIHTSDQHAQSTHQRFHPLKE